MISDPIKALDPATAARCWDMGIKGTMAGKTRVLVVNSQMLQRFASDSAVSRLIIVENDGTAAGCVTYNGPPSDMPLEIQERLGDGYFMAESPTVAPAEPEEPEEPEEPAQAEPEVEAEPEEEAAQTGKTSADASMVDYYSKDASGNKEPSLDKEGYSSPAKPAAAGTEGSAEQEQPKKESAAKDSKAAAKPKAAKETVKSKGSIPGSVVAYCRRMGVWIVVSAAGMVATQAAGLGLYAWYEHWAADTFKFGFRKNYVIAIIAMLGAQLTRFLQGMTDGVGGEGASKSIRLDINEKLRLLAMPYLWDPGHSTAQMVDLVTKDPNEYRLFAMMPLLLSSAGFSLCAVLYAKPIITPGAIIALYAYKYVKKPFGACTRLIVLPHRLCYTTLIYICARLPLWPLCVLSQLLLTFSANVSLMCPIAICCECRVGHPSSVRWLDLGGLGWHAQVLRRDVRRSSDGCCDGTAGGVQLDDQREILDALPALAPLLREHRPLEFLRYARRHDLGDDFDGGGDQHARPDGTGRRDRCLQPARGAQLLGRNVLLVQRRRCPDAPELDAGAGVPRGD